MEIQEGSSRAPSTSKNDSEPPQKNQISELDSSLSTKKEYNYSTDRAFLTWNVMPPTLKSSSKTDLDRDDSLTSQLSTENFQFKPKLTPLYMVSTPYKFQLKPNRYNDHYISYASKQLALYDYLTTKIQKIFTVQVIHLRPSMFDLHNDDSNSSFQSVYKKRIHLETYKCS